MSGEARQSAEWDALRRKHNAAVANGLLLRARQIDRAMTALETHPVPTGSEANHG